MNVQNFLIVYGPFLPVLILSISHTEWLAHWVMHQKWAEKYPLTREMRADHLDHHRHYNGLHPECHEHEHEGGCFRIRQFGWVGIMLCVVTALPFFVLEYFTTFEHFYWPIAFVSWYAFFLIYETFHDSAHRPENWPRKKLYDPIRGRSIPVGNTMDVIIRLHITHHTKAGRKNYGGLLPFFDAICGTATWAGKKQVFAWRAVAVSAATLFLFCFFSYGMKKDQHERPRQTQVAKN